MLHSSRSAIDDYNWRKVRHAMDKEKPTHPDTPEPQRPVKPQGDVDAPGKGNPPPPNPPPGG